MDNVATLLRMSGLLPSALDIAPLLDEAKAQLIEEADYFREAEQMRRYATLLADDARFTVPQPLEDWTTAQVLVMDFIEAQPIDLLEREHQTVRDRVTGGLLDLVLQELFTFGYMQTDPNFANYRWQPDSQRIVLLDFGAARPVPRTTSAAYRAMLEAGLAGNRARLRTALVNIGFVSSTLPVRHDPLVDAMIDAILTHIAKPGPFDFADRSFVAQLRELAMPIVTDRSNWHLPPAETLFVQRKVSGMALLAVRMQARVPLLEMVAAALGDHKPLQEHVV